MTLLVLVIVSIAYSAPLAYIAIARPGLRLLAFRPSIRRPGRAILVVSGAVLATAIVTSSSVLGDSLGASIRRSAVTQLGPVDEEILGVGIDRGRAIRSAVERTRSPDVGGSLSLLGVVTTVRGRDFIPRVAQAQVLEVDFAAASRFGGDPSATGMTGPTPTGDAAVLSADLSNLIAIRPRHRVTVYAFGTSRTFRIARLLPRVGVAGLATPLSPSGSESFNIFVPSGTFAAMLADPSRDRAVDNTGIGAQGLPVSIVAVSNRETGSGDRRTSAAVTTQLRAATSGLDVEVHPVKQQLLDDADRRSRSFTDLFRAFGFFGAAGGVVLLILTFSILARDRVRSMGILRAQGLSRRDTVAALALEGWLYTIVGISAGALGGVALGAVALFAARDVFGSPVAGSVELVFSARAASIAAGCAIGLIIALSVVLGAAAIVSRRNIVRVMRRMDDPPHRPGRSALVASGAGLCAAGVAIGVTGITIANPVASLAGPALFALGVVLFLYTPARARRLISIASLAVFVWSALAVTIVRDAFTHLGTGVVVAVGVVTTFCAVALAAVNHNALIRPFVARPGRRAPAFTLGLAYARTARLRTVLIMGMFATVLFTLTLLITIRQLYGNDVRDLGRRLGGKSAIEIASNPVRPVPPRDVARLDGVTHVAAAAATRAQIQTALAAPAGTSAAGASADARDVTVVGFDDTFIGHGSPPLAGSASRRSGQQRGEPEASIYRTVAGDPTRVLVGADLDADRLSGFPAGRLRIGDPITLRNPATGAMRTLTVGGLVAAARYGGSDHVYAARSVVDQLLGTRATSNLLFVETNEGVNNDVLAAVVDGTHLANGAYARSFERLARESVSTRRQFLDVSAGYAAIGLVAALAGVAIVMIDRVRERRRQISMLRAFGCRAATVSRACRVETAVIALEGTIIGTVCGLLITWRLSSNGGLGQRLPFDIPVILLLLIAAVVVATSVAAATVPARRAARLEPAAMLRADD
ncbi:MAG: putative transport system permease protein [Actinomycetota bacterium]|nr:putative transport system permease protein [Actinomycetota bacterium]